MIQILACIKQAEIYVKLGDIKLAKDWLRQAKERMNK